MAVTGRPPVPGMPDCGMLLPASVELFVLFCCVELLLLLLVTALLLPVALDCCVALVVVALAAAPLEPLLFDCAAAALAAVVAAVGAPLYDICVCGDGYGLFTNFYDDHLFDNCVFFSC